MPRRDASSPRDVEIAGMKSKTPDNWKEEKPSSNMRLTQFKLPKAEGDPEDAELIIFYFQGGSGDAEANLKRQLAKFKPAEGKDKVEVKVDKIKVGTYRGPVPGHHRHVPASSGRTPRPRR